MRSAVSSMLLLSVLAGAAQADAPLGGVDNVLGGYLSGTSNQDQNPPGRTSTHDEEGVPVDPGTAGFQGGAAGLNGGTAGRRAGEAGLPPRQPETHDSRDLPATATAAPTPAPTPRAGK